MKILSSIAVLAGTYIVIDQYQLLMKRLAAKKAARG
jgi:phosphomevalonate kinase